MAFASSEVDPEEDMEMTFYSSDEELVMTYSSSSDEDEYHPIPIGLSTPTSAHGFDDSSSDEDSSLQFDGSSSIAGPSPIAVQHLAGMDTLQPPSDKSISAHEVDGSSSVAGPSPIAVPGLAGMDTLQPPSDKSTSAHEVDGSSSGEDSSLQFDVPTIHCRTTIDRPQKRKGRPQKRKGRPQKRKGRPCSSGSSSTSPSPSPGPSPIAVPGLAGMDTLQPPSDKSTSAHEVDGSSSGEDSSLQFDVPTIHCRTTRGRSQKRRDRPSSSGSSSTSPSPRPSPIAVPGLAGTLPPPPDWSNDPSIEFKIPPLLSTSSINIFKNSSECPTACEVFEEFFSKEFWQILKKGTNLYARQKRRISGYSNYSMLQKWKAVTLKELKVYFTILLRSGLVRKPEMSCYWQRDEIYAETFSPTRMSRDRYRAITSMLHVGDNKAFVPFEDGHDPLHKLRPFISFLQDKFRSIYTPQQNISLDEATCPFKGRLKFKVYNKNKPHKWGIKLFEICESNSGYCFEFKVFCGIEREQTKAKTHQLVMDMMERYLDKNHHLFMDQYYSSPELYCDLALRGTLATGTCMANRKGLPKSFLSQKIKRGQVISCKKDSLMALKWFDKKEVLMLSTAYCNSVSTVKVRGPLGLHDKEKPTAVQHYNSNMGGVDLSDQLMSYYTFSRKSFKWWRKLFFHLVNLGIVNSSIVYNMIRKKHGKPVMSLLNFMNEIIKNLATISSDEAALPPVKTDRLSARKFGHFPQRIPGTPSNPKPRRPCKVCADVEKHAAETECRKRRKTARKDTLYWCRKCEIPLCVDDCFMRYHTCAKYEIIQ